MDRDNASVRGIHAMTALVIVGTFLSGALTGAGVYHWLSPHRSHGLHGPGGPRPFGELNLSPEQDRKLKAIMDAHRPELEAVLRETFPKVRAVHERIDAELRKVLNPEQQKRFDQWKAEHPEHDGRMGPHGRGGGPHAEPGGPGFGPP
jgi:Spy/CpxP family protein refolding chaperone